MSWKFVVSAFAGIKVRNKYSAVQLMRLANAVQTAPRFVQQCTNLIDWPESLLPYLHDVVSNVDELAWPARCFATDLGDCNMDSRLADSFQRDIACTQSAQEFLQFKRSVSLKKAMTLACNPINRVNQLTLEKFHQYLLRLEDIANPASLLLQVLEAENLSALVNCGRTSVGMRCIVC